MKNCLCLFCFLLASALSCLADSVYKPSRNCLGCPQAIVLDAGLTQAIEIFDCKAISGMVCRIGLRSDARALPSEIFIQSFGADGSKIGHPIRLIYPNLKRGETGWATFRIERGDRLKAVRLTGKWEGAWKSPY
jgi:hypothetical protein